MTKDVKTLKEDIYHVLRTGEGYTKEIAEWVGHDIAQSLKRQLGEVRKEQPRTIRLSSLGTPCERKLWYSVNWSVSPEPLPPATKNKFIFGDITESHILGLAKASGHSVRGLQTQLDVFGIKGHRDCIIDGMLFDVKSASTQAMGKFKDNGLRGDDPFGYLSQISSYLYGSRDEVDLVYKDKAGFLAFDKQFGHIEVDIYDMTEDLSGKKEEILRKKDLVTWAEPPERSFTPVPDGKSGNMKLSTQCSYCNFKKECYPEARKFIYSNGPRYFTKVVREPRETVIEVPL